MHDPGELGIGPLDLAIERHRQVEDRPLGDERQVAVVAAHERPDRPTGHDALTGAELFGGDVHLEGVRRRAVVVGHHAGEDDQRVAAGDHARADRRRGRALDHVGRARALQVGHLGDDSPRERQPATHPLVAGDGDDRHRGPVRRRLQGRIAGLRGDDDPLRTDVTRQEPRRPGQGVRARRAGRGHPPLAHLGVLRAGLHGIDDARHRLDDGHRALADGRLARQHDRIRPVEDGVGHVRRLRARRARLGDHRVEHLGGRDDRHARLACPADDPLLLHGDLLEGAFNAEVTAGDHDAVRGLEDRREVVQRGAALDFGDDRHLDAARLERLADFVDVRAVDDEARRDEVHAALGDEVEVRLVGVGDDVQAEVDAGDVHAGATLEVAAGLDAGVDGLALDGGDGRLEAAVIEEDPVAHRHGTEVDAHADHVIRGRGVVDEPHLVTGGQRERGLRRDGADLRPLQVEHRRQRALALASDGLYPVEEVAAVGGRPVARVEPGDRHPRVREVGDRLAVLGGRPEGGDDLRVAHAARLWCECP